PRQLVEGWLRPTHWYQPYLFLLAGTALLVGVPFLAVFYLAGHDLSRTYTTRGYHLTDSEIYFPLWGEFWDKVEGQAMEVGEKVPSSKMPALSAGQANSKREWRKPNPGRFIWEQLSGDVEEVQGNRATRD